jgi:O-antigen ligase
VLTMLILAVWFAILNRRMGFYEQGMMGSHGARVETPWNANAFGILMLTGIIGLAYFWGMGKRWYLRFGIPPLAIFLALALLSSASRKSLAALVFFAVLWMWFCYRRYLYRNLFVLAVAVTVLIGLFYLVRYAREDTLMGQRFESLEREGGGLGEDRTALYVRGFQLIAEHPIAGVGLGNYIVVSGMYEYSHSEYIEILSTTGLVGGLLYFPIYWLMWRRLSRVSRLSDDKETRYRVGVFKSAILSFLALAVGAPNFLGPEMWFLLAGIMGYSAGVYRDLAAAPVPVARPNPRQPERPLPGPYPSPGTTR